MEIVRLAFFALILCGSPTLISTPAHACSVDWKKGKSPKEVRRSPYVKRVAGTYHVEELAGYRKVDEEDGVEKVYDAQFLGTLTSKNGRKWKTIHEPILETGITCVDARNAEFRVPEGNAQGVFWIEIRSRQGRHKLREWDGEYLPYAGESKIKE